MAQAVDEESCYTATKANYQQLNVKGSQDSLFGRVYLDYMCEQQLHNRWIHPATLCTPSAMEGAELHVQEGSLSYKVAKMRRLQGALAESRVHLARCESALYRAECQRVRVEAHASHAKLCLAACHNCHLSNHDQQSRFQS